MKLYYSPAACSQAIHIAVRESNIAAVLQAEGLAKA